MDLQTRSIENVKILSLYGRFDTYNASPARSWIEEATTSMPAYLVVNLENVQFMDSTALSVLVQGMKRSRQLDGDLRLCNVPASIRMILELTRLDKVFEIFPEENQAVQAFIQGE
jgi:anti-sigma B factor antagonist